MRDAAFHSSLVVPADATRSFLRVEGEDAIQLLDGLITQDIAGMPDAHASFGMLLTAKARIMSPALVYRASPERVLLEVPSGCRDDVYLHLRRYRLRARVELEHVDAGRVLVLSDDPPNVPGTAWCSSHELGSRMSYAHVGSLKECTSLYNELSHGVDPGIATAACTVVRLEQGMPGFPDFMVDYMPAEVGADTVAVSFTKGCYLGQEPVARLHWRGHANRTLRRLELDTLPTSDTRAPIELAPVEGTTRSAGIVTSWAQHPNGPILALGIIRRDIPRDTILHATSGLQSATVCDDAPVSRSSR